MLSPNTSTGRLGNINMSMWYLWLMSQVVDVIEFDILTEWRQKRRDCLIVIVKLWIFFLSGKEKLLGDAYIDHVLALDSPQITYITFDFHEYCRGLKFENVAVLLESIQDILKGMRYCWVDHKVRLEITLHLNYATCERLINSIQIFCSTLQVLQWVWSTGVLQTWQTRGNGYQVWTETFWFA